MYSFDNYAERTQGLIHLHFIYVFPFVTNFVFNMIYIIVIIQL